MSTTSETNNSDLALIVAGSYSEYLNWRRDNPFVKCCKYIERMEDLRGVHGFFANIVLYGNYENNPVYQSKKMRSLLAEHTSPFRAYVH